MDPNKFIKRLQIVERGFDYKKILQDMRVKFFKQITTWIKFKREL